MKKLAIIGGGIIGLTLANYIDLSKYNVTLFDNPTGQATKASAGIISPWLSKRRNKKWYHLAKSGAAFYPKLIQDFSLPPSVYQQTGTLILRKDGELEPLARLAEERKLSAPEIGDIQLLHAQEVSTRLPLLKQLPALSISGGGKLDGASYLDHLRRHAVQKNIELKTVSAQLERTQSHWLIHTETQTEAFDTVALCAGPGLSDLLTPLGYKIDIRAQKGQLLAFETSYKNSGNWYVAMLDGESDLIPFENGRILIGATHENEAGFDLTPTEEAYTQLKQKSIPFLSNSAFFEDHSFAYRVGTRAYTSDFAPFFNCLPNDSTAVVASGLGSSGLTTGPYIGFLLAQYFNEGQHNWQDFQKTIDTYIVKEY
ncbi:NAD(P)/FAD-dependent oxidoreductase [Enterococcus termitis]